MVDISRFVAGGRTGLLASLHLSLVVSKPGCLAWLCEWTDSFVCLCLPLFGPGGSQPGCPGSIVFLLSSSLDAWQGSLGGRIHVSPFVSLYLSAVVTGSCAVCSAGRHVCLRLRNACLSARVRLIKPQAACCGCASSELLCVLGVFQLTASARSK